MQRLGAFALLALAACSGGLADGQPDTDAGASSDGSTCGTVISFDPFAPEANPVAPIRAAVNVVGSMGVFTYTWHVAHDNATVMHTQESSDNSQIGFIAADPGIYYVSVTIQGPTSCPYADAPLNVLAPNANTVFYRLRTVPPANAGAPPQEQVVQVRGGADVNRDITLDPGVSAAGVVRNGSSGPGVPAYVKFMPQSMPGAFTELFTQSNGNYSTQLVGLPHDVLVIPSSTALAPKLVAWTPQTQSLVVGPGTVVSGSVLGPAGTGLGGAKVQLSAGGVPSTVGTTAGNGSFSLRADLPSGMITVKVTPPASSGLPRLEAVGAFNVATTMQIAYGSSLATCNLLNTPVRRNAANQAGAKVTVVGSLAGISGTVTAGAAANALGSVRIAASADGGGQLPSMLVPRATNLSAVVQLGAEDFAVDSTLDTSGCAVTQIDAPPLIVASGTTKLDATAPLGGVRVEATPVGALALADAQTIATTSNNTTGAFSLSLAAGGLYDVRFIDPYARVARREELDIAAPAIPVNAIMPVALAIKGKVSISGVAQPLSGASIHLLCATCTGVDAARPVAATATNILSEYSIAVPDPGTM